MRNERSTSLDWIIGLLLGLTAATVPLVYYTNPIATEYFFAKSFYAVVLVYLALALYFAKALLKRRLTMHWGTTFPAVLAFALVGLQSLVGAINPWKGIETIARVGTAIPFMLLLYQTVAHREEIFRLLRIMALANLAIAFYGVLQYYEVLSLPKDQYGTPDPSTTLGLTNFAMEYYAPFMFVMPSMVFVEPSRLWRVGFSLAAASMYYYFVLSDNRAAMVGWLAGAGVFALLVLSQDRHAGFRNSRRFWRPGLMVALALAGLIAMSPQGSRIAQRFQSIFAVGHFDDAITFRLETWRQALAVFADHPLRGVGLSNLEVIFPRYQSNFLEAMTLKKNTRVVRAHNEYLQVLADLGLLGAVIFAWFLVSLARLGWKAYRQAHAWNDSVVVAGLLAGMSAFLVMAFFSFPFEVPASSLAIFLNLGLLESLTNRILPGATDPAWTVPERITLPVAGLATASTFALWAASSAWLWQIYRAEVFFKESRVTKELNRWNVSKELLDRAIAAYPMNEAYYYDRSIFSIRQGDSTAALHDLEVTAKLVPYYGMARKQLGLLYAQRGDYRKALEELSAAYAIYRHQHAEFIPLLVTAHIGLGSPEAGVALVEKALAQGMVDPEILFYGGQAYMAAHRFDAAIALYRRTLAMRPDHTDARVFLAMALAETGDGQGALAAAEAALQQKLTPNQALTASIARIKALIFLHRGGEAAAFATALLAQHPSARARMRQDPTLVQAPELARLLPP